MKTCHECGRKVRRTYGHLDPAGVAVYSCWDCLPKQDGLEALDEARRIGLVNRFGFEPNITEILDGKRMVLVLGIL